MLLARNRFYRHRNLEGYNRRNYQRFLERVSKDPSLKLRSNLQSSWGRRCQDRGVYDHEPFLSLLGCSWEQFCAYLESQFAEGMSWEPYGETWVLDHRYPLHCFALADPIERQVACHHTNFVPLPPESNLRKSCYYHCQGLKEWKRNWHYTHGPGKPAGRVSNCASEVEVPF